MRRRHIFCLLIFVLIVTVTGWFHVLKSGSYVCEAAETAVDFEGLKRILESDLTAQISLEQDICIEETIRVRGKKYLDGNGHILRRWSQDSATFGGTLFEIEGGECQITNVVIHGEGNVKAVQKKTYGRLLDITSGNVVLGASVILCDNCNTCQNNDGGGAVRIHNSGSLTLDGAVIKDNQNVTAGAGVYVEQGGRLTLKDGILTGNCSVGLGPVEGFDGRGGAIYSEGYVAILGGKIYKNKAEGYRKDEIVYGGAGGAIYAGRTSELHISGGTISGNEARAGANIYREDAVKKTEKDTVNESKKSDKEKISKSGQKKKKSSRKISDRKDPDGSKTVKGKSEKNIIEKTDPDGSKTKEVKQEERKHKENLDKNNSKRAESGEEKSQKKPKIRVTERYFFREEIQNFTEQDWENELLKECRIIFGAMKKEEISYHWEWNGLLSNRTGKYRVKLNLRGLCSSEIPVNVFENDNEQVSEESGICLKFCDSKSDGTEKFRGQDQQVEIWHFSQSDIRRLKDFMRDREDPFSQRTNQDFFVRFKSCRKKGGLFGERQ